MIQVKVSVILMTCLFFIVAGVSPLFAKDLGVWGQVYPIAEPDILDFIHARLGALQKDGQLQKMQEQFTHNVIAHTLRPTPVSGMGEVTTSRIFYYDPTFTAPINVYNQQGIMVVKAGTRVNPFDYTTLREVLLFINADDPAQVKWALATKQKFDLTKIILVEGNIKTASTDDHLGRIYFDQDGVLCKKLGITAVPALVMQSGKQLKIEELPVDGLGAQS